jgi:hypothetical protein
VKIRLKQKASGKQVQPIIEVIQLNDNEKLRRFVDLPKVCDLLSTQYLTLCSLGHLISADPFECSVRRQYDGWTKQQLQARALELREIVTEIRGGRAESFENDIWEFSETELKHAVWQLEREELKKSLACSCWHRGEVESDAMWKIYARTLGVSVVSSVKRIRDAMQPYLIPGNLPCDFKLFLEPVTYAEQVECGANDKPWLFKRKAFEHEKEVRLYCMAPMFDRNGLLRVPVRIADLIEEIVITPFAEHWEYEAIRAAIEALLTKVRARHIGVRRSRHSSAPLTMWPALSRMFLKTMDDLSKRRRPRLAPTAIHNSA